jgi:hypothetical protein
MITPPLHHPLRRMFAGVTEHAFQTSLGVADPPLTDYLAEILSRFTHADALFPLRDGQGRRLDEVGQMLAEAQKLPPEGRTAREAHRQVGDVTLFWTGLFPEALERLRSVRKDAFIDYCLAGKHAYYVASSFDDDSADPAPAVLRRLAEQFELCAYGLQQVRRELDAMSAEGRAVPGPVRLIG